MEYSDLNIVNLLTNSGLTVIGMDNDFLYLEDPSCIFPVFDTILNYAWIVILVLTAFMLLGWGVLYIKNGVKVDDLFKNARSVILIFCVLSVVKPAVNLVYGDNLFEKQCEIEKISLTNIKELLDSRNKQLSKSKDMELYESFNVVDSGAIYDSTEEIQ
ncbi:MAG: hypothetical protein IKP35_01660 [Alphaproteobacteria bacterium]|nr:hypothetical protein [Alphaproteobacteria bacterium]MBR6010109.1 hypothetical protein [Alphaproteobacteria bacterium]